jgi:hypothetical protein
MITNDDIEVYTEGDCFVLAQAVHEITGWPMCAFSYDNTPDLHAFVMTPDGKYLDIEGKHTPKQLRKKWQCGLDINEYTVDEFKLWGEPNYDIGGERARELAQHLIETT